MSLASYIVTIIILVSVFIFLSERILKQLEEEQQSRKSAEEKFKMLEGQCKLLCKELFCLKERADQKLHVALSSCQVKAY